MSALRLKEGQESPLPATAKSTSKLSGLGRDLDSEEQSSLPSSASCWVDQAPSEPHVSSSVGQGESRE